MLTKADSLLDMTGFACSLIQVDLILLIILHETVVMCGGSLHEYPKKGLDFQPGEIKVRCCYPLRQFFLLPPSLPPSYLYPSYILPTHSLISLQHCLRSAAQLLLARFIHLSCLYATALNGSYDSHSFPPLILLVCTTLTSLVPTIS